MWAHTAPETAKRVKSSGQNLDKKKVQSLSKIESTDCIEYCRTAGCTKDYDEVCRSQKFDEGGDQDGGCIKYKDKV